MDHAESPAVTVEFAVDMNCQSCEEAIKESLKNVPGVRNVQVDFKRETVFIESSLPATSLQELIENTGRKAVLRGIGLPGSQLCAAVVEFYGMNGVKGVTRFVQLAENECIVDGTLDGLSPGPHGLAVCESGDLSRGCERYFCGPEADTVGDHYNPHSGVHGSPNNSHAHVGDLGNIIANESGRASFRIRNSHLKLWDLIGRSLAVHAGEDDYGKGSHVSSKIDGNAGPKIACGIIARSAGIMENTKKICSCSGATLWEEREEAKAENAYR